MFYVIDYVLLMMTVLLGDKNTVLAVSEAFLDDFCVTNVDKLADKCKLLCMCIRSTITCRDSY